MEEDEIKQKAKLGIFVLAAVVLFLIAVIFIGNASNFFSKTFEISGIFKNVEGLKEGDKVWLSGVQIGTVKQVRIVVIGEVVVTLALKEKQNDFIRKNATASIGSDGLIGNKIVVIEPGNALKIIEDGDTINAVSPADTQGLINIAKEVGENTRSITVDLMTISSKINRGQGIIGELLNEGPFAKKLRLTVDNLEATGENAKLATARLAGLVDDMKHGNGLLPTLISDTTFKGVFAQTLVSVKKVSRNAEMMSASLEGITAKMDDHDNAVGVLLADTSFAHKLQRTMKNTESATYRLNENMEALKHNFLTRGYFKKQAKQEQKDHEKEQKQVTQDAKPN